MAGLVRRTPRRYIRISKAADMLDCSSESIRTGAVGKFNLVPMNPMAKKPYWLVDEAEVIAFMERREREAAVY